MIWTIATREFLDYLKSLRFLIGLLVTVALVGITTAINVSDYRQRLQDYSAARQDIKGDPFNVKVFRAPEPLSTLVQGKDRAFGNLAEMNPLDIPMKTSGYMGGYLSQHHRFVSGFAAIDFAFIVRVVLSLLVIFLVYNAVAGEKSSGTLRQALANPLPRHALLVGKLIGGLGAVLVSLSFAVITALLIVILNPALSLHGEDWGRILAVVALSALYLTTFFALGLFVSVAANRPTTALALLLQAWIFLIVIYPNLAIVGARNIVSIPSEEEMDYRKRVSYEQYDRKLKAIHEEINKTYASGGGFSAELMMKSTDVMAEAAQAKHLIDLEMHNALREQARIAETVSRISPSFIYDRSVERLARTGMDEVDRFTDALGRYWHEYIEATKARWRAFATRTEVKFPEFTFSPESPGETFAASMIDVLVLALVSLIFFALSYTVFLRKDVR
jgi:ABC-type transport system involved in multi-copper enzyme maturation permease subunit